MDARETLAAAGKGVIASGRGAVATAGIAGILMGANPTAAVQASGLAPALQEPAVTLMENVAEAIEADTKARSEGEDAANAEQIRGPESSEFRDPEPGYTNALLGVEPQEAESDAEVTEREYVAEAAEAGLAEGDEATDGGDLERDAAEGGTG